MSATAYLFHLLTKGLMPLAQISLENKQVGILKVQLSKMADKIDRLITACSASPWVNHWFGMEVVAGLFFSIWWGCGGCLGRFHLENVESGVQ